MIAPPSANDNGQEIKQYTEHIVPTEVEQFDDKTLVLTADLFTSIRRQISRLKENINEQEDDEQELKYNEADWKKVKKIIRKKFKDAQVVRSFDLDVDLGLDPDLFKEKHDAYVFTSNDKHYLVCPGTDADFDTRREKPRIMAKFIMGEVAGGKASIVGFRTDYEADIYKGETLFLFFPLDDITINGKPAVDVLN